MHERDLFIDGRWRASQSGRRLAINDPATRELEMGCIGVNVNDTTDLQAPFGGGSSPASAETWPRAPDGVP